MTIVETTLVSRLSAIPDPPHNSTVPAAEGALDGARVPLLAIMNTDTELPFGDNAQRIGPHGPGLTREFGVVWFNRVCQVPPLGGRKTVAVAVYGERRNVPDG